MKKIMITLSFCILAFVSKASDPITVAPCYEYMPSIGWVVKYNYTANNCLQFSVKFRFHYNGVNYGTVISQPFGNPGYVVIPTHPVLLAVIEREECFEVDYVFKCNNQDPFPTSYLTLFEVCPCSPTDEDQCIGHFEHKINTSNFSPSSMTPKMLVTFDDNEFPQIFNALPGITSHYTCSPFPNNLPPSPKVKITDTWDVTDATMLNNFSYSINSHSNGALYDVPNLSHEPFTRNLYTGTTIKICHRKTIEESCGPGYVTGSQTPSIPSAILYDCKVCMDVCLNPVELDREIEVVFTNWDPHSDRPAKKEGSLAFNVGFNNISVYPNPTDELVNISFTHQSSEEILSISIVDITGKEVLSKSQKSAVGNNLIQLDVSNLSNGNYLVTLFDKSGNRFKQKVTIQ